MSSISAMDGEVGSRAKGCATVLETLNANRYRGGMMP